MKKYIQPSYEMEGVKTEDIMLTSIMISSSGSDTLGSITGERANLTTSFEDLLFGLR